MQADTLRSVPFLNFKTIHKRSETYIYAPSRFTLYSASESVSMFDEHLTNKSRLFKVIHAATLRCIFDASLL